MGILPRNDPALVEKAAELLGIPPSTVFSLSVPEGNPSDLKLAFAGTTAQMQQGAGIDKGALSGLDLGLAGGRWRTCLAKPGLPAYFGMISYRAWQWHSQA